MPTSGRIASILAQYCGSHAVVYRQPWSVASAAHSHTGIPWMWQRAICAVFSRTHFSLAEALRTGAYRDNPQFSHVQWSPADTLQNQSVVVGVIRQHASIRRVSGDALNVHCLSGMGKRWF